MNRKLLLQGTAKLISGALALGLTLFVPAGTMAFAGAWRMIVMLCVCMLAIGAVLYAKAPELLEKRLNTRETEPEQKVVIAASALLFTASFVLCGLDRRMGWSHLPAWLIAFGAVLFIAAYLGFTVVLRQNAYLSRTVEVQDGQQVVSTGLYGVVRHPMYMIILGMFFSMPLIIGSAVGMIPLLGLPVILVLRIKNEEEVLEAGLPGYREYKQKVRYRMIPFIW